MASNLTVDIIIGYDLLREHQFTIKMGKGGDIMHINHRGTAMTMNWKSSHGVLSCADVTVGKLLHVPPQCELEVKRQIPLSAINKTWVLEGSKQSNSAVLVACAVIRSDSAEVPFHILNIRDETITIWKGTIIAETEVLPTDSVSMVGALQQSSAGMKQHEALWKMAEKAGNETNMEEKEQLSALLLEYQDPFARSSDYFGCTGKLKHAIDMEGCKPVRQCTRRMSPAKKEEHQSC